MFSVACLGVSQSVYNAVTFERLDLESLLFFIQVRHQNLQVNFVYQDDWIKVKVVSLLATDRRGIQKYTPLGLQKNIYFKFVSEVSGLVLRP